MKIGNVTIETPIFLAPMAGVTDIAFRRVCRMAGAGLATTEMVSSRALLYQDKKSNQLMTLDREESPSCVQLFGNDPDAMAEAAKIVCERTNCSILDINMGCPTPKIVNNGDGSALMKNPALAGEIVKRVRAAIDIPVTVKFRKGWDSGSVNAVEFAKVVEGNGADAITVHGRTRQAMYSGRVDLDVIREVKRAVSIPVVANGDIFSVDDARRAFNYTGADAIMVGRGAFGNPWIFTQLKAFVNGEEIPPLPSLKERLGIAHGQILYAAEHKGERVAILEARRHLAWYLKGVRGANFYKEKICHLNSMEELSRTVREIGDTLGG